MSILALCRDLFFTCLSTLGGLSHDDFPSEVRSSGTSVIRGKGFPRPRDNVSRTPTHDPGLQVTKP